MRVPPALVLATAILAGCIEPPASDPTEEHAFSGVFLTTVAPDEIASLETRTLGEGGDFFSDGKVPATFLARGLTKSGCDVVRGFAATMQVFETLGDCGPVDIAVPVAPGPIPPVAPTGPVLASMPVG